VNFTKTQKVKQHCSAPSHQKNLEAANQIRATQPTLEGVFARQKNGTVEKAKVDLILDKELQDFRGEVLAKCLKAGIEKEKVAKIADLLSTPKFKMPSSSSSLSDYIPYLHECLRKELLHRLGKEYASMPAFFSCILDYVLGNSQ
jgi:hypothetical protein